MIAIFPFTFSAEAQSTFLAAFVICGIGEMGGSACSCRSNPRYPLYTTYWIGTWLLCGKSEFSFLLLCIKHTPCKINARYKPNL